MDFTNYFKDIMTKLINIKNKKFGFLTVLEIDKTRTDRIFWLCKCDCGNVKSVAAKHLRSGAIKSCSCKKSLPQSGSNSWKGYKEISGRYFNRLKNGAKNRNFAFEITIEEIWELFKKQNSKCAMTNLDICFGKNQTASLDRIDSSKSYTIDNVQWVHKDVNYMKMDFSIERFLFLCNLITKKAQDETSNNI